MRKAACFLLALVLVPLFAGVPNVCAQTNTTCTDIQTGGVPDSIALRLRGVIVTAVRKSGASGGFWVQDRPSGGQGAQGDPFSGIFCFLGKNPTVQLGDSVTLVGTYMEFFEQTEFNMRDCKTITGVDSLTFVHRVGAVVPAPRKLTACVLGPDGVIINQPPMEQWEGILVELDSVRVRSDLSNGEYSLEETDGDSLCVGLADTCLADDKFPHQQPPVGTFCRFFRGVFDETFTEHKIEPRGDFDIVISPFPAPSPEFAYVTSNTTIEIRWTYPLDVTTAQNIANYSLLSGDFSLNTAMLVESTLVRLTTGNQAPFRNLIAPQRIDIINVKNSDGITMNPGFVQFIAGVSDINFVQTQKTVSNDSTRVAGLTVCVAGVVTCGTSEALNSNGARFFIETTGGGPRSGLSVFNTQNLASVARGDSVRVAGLVGEFFNNTEISILDFVQVLGTKPVPGPNVVTLAVAKTEDYEGVHVKVNGPLVVRLAPDPANPFFNEVPLTAPAGTDTLLFNDLDGGGYAPLSLAVDDTLCFIQGPMDWSFGNRKVSPRNWLDICDQNATGVGDVSSIVPARSRLDQNLPNPFNPRTMITFALAKPGKASLVVYDISGRAVRTLVQGNLKASEYREFWDGRRDDGVEVSSGIYFYKLSTPSFVETRKMVLLK